MPLKTQLCDRSGAVIEQILFSSIDLPERIPDSMFKPLVDASNYRWLRAERQWPSDRRAAEQTDELAPLHVTSQGKFLRHS